MWPSLLSSWKARAKYEQSTELQRTSQKSYIASYTDKAAISRRWSSKTICSTKTYHCVKYSRQYDLQQKQLNSDHASEANEYRSLDCFGCLSYRTYTYSTLKERAIATQHHQWNHLSIRNQVNCYQQDGFIRAARIRVDKKIQFNKTIWQQMRTTR